MVFAAQRIRAVSPSANITFVSDKTSLADVDRRTLGALFNVLIRSDTAMPDIGRTESMGFRLQKLRGMVLTPYARTIYMDSDTFLCRSVDELFAVLRRVDVACAHGGRGNHSGASAGVLAYASTLASAALWKAWEAEYRSVMHVSRREQPSFQRALALATESHGLRIEKLALSYNCRNVRDCLPARLKDGQTAQCSIIHAHDFAESVTHWRNVENSDSRHKKRQYTSPCPMLSGGHRLIVILYPPSKRQLPWSEATVHALSALTLDNDFSLCDLRALGTVDDAKKGVNHCVAKSNRYSVVVTASFEPSAVNLEGAVTFAISRHPLARLRAVLDDLDLESRQSLELCVATPGAKNCFGIHKDLAPNADVAWFCAHSPQCSDKALRDDPEAAYATAIDNVRDNFLAVGVADAMWETAREFERALPSHFLRLATKLGSPRSRRGALPVELKRAFLAANDLDLRLYTSIHDNLKARKLKCPVDYVNPTDVKAHSRRLYGESTVPEKEALLRRVR